MTSVTCNVLARELPVPCDREVCKCRDCLRTPEQLEQGNRMLTGPLTDGFSICDACLEDRRRWA